MSENESNNSQAPPAGPEAPAPAPGDIDAKISEAMQHEAFANGRHPDHRRHMAMIEKLYERKHAGAGNMTPPQSVSVRVGLGKPEQPSPAAEARDLMNDLVNLGFERADVPDDIQPWQVDALKMQRAHAAGDYDALVPQMRRALHMLKLPPGQRAVFDQFVALPDLDENLRDTVADAVIHYYYRAAQQRYGEKRK